MHDADHYWILVCDSHQNQWSWPLGWWVTSHYHYTIVLSRIWRIPMIHCHDLNIHIQHRQTFWCSLWNINLMRYLQKLLQVPESDKRDIVTKPWWVSTTFCSGKSPTNNPNNSFISFHNYSRQDQNVLYLIRVVCHHSCHSIYQIEFINKQVW